MDELQESLARSPEWFPHSLDVRNDSVAFVRLTQSDYARASFLDGRILNQQTIGRVLPWLQVEALVNAAHLAEQCAFIFHIGHVGSTLLSRLIGAHPRVFALREPLILRSFAQAGSESARFEAQLGSSLKLLSRTFNARQTAVIKATSFVSELAANLMSRASRPHAVAIYVSPESYMATILGGPNSRQEAKLLTPSRLARLHGRIGREVWRAETLSEGETLALAWACEMSALALVANTARERVYRVDFDQFLRDPTALLGVFAHFGIEASAADVRAILAGPDMGRYSKAPEFAYDGALRAAVLNEARATHGAEIKRGLAWLERSSADFDAVRQAMAFST
jgi:hypothetical protein